MNVLDTEVLNGLRDGSNVRLPVSSRASLATLNLRDFRLSVRHLPELRVVDLLGSR